MVSTRAPMCVSPPPQNREILLRLDAVSEGVSVLVSGRGEHPPDAPTAASAQAAVAEAEDMWTDITRDAKLTVRDTHSHTCWQQGLYTIVLCWGVKA